KEKIALSLRTLGRRRRQREHASVPEHHDLAGTTDPLHIQRPLQSIDVGDDFAVVTDDEVAGLDSRSRGGTAALDIANADARRISDSMMPRNPPGERCIHAGDTQPTAAHASMG